MDGFVDRLREIDSIEFMRSQVHVVLAGVLVVLLGLELTETVKMYLAERVIHMEVVFVVALIAVARHVIVLDHHHAEPMQHSVSPLSFPAHRSVFPLAEDAGSERGPRTR